MIITLDFVDYIESSKHFSHILHVALTVHENTHSACFLSDICEIYLLLLHKAANCSFSRLVEVLHLSMPGFIFSFDDHFCCFQLEIIKNEFSINVIQI